MVCILPPEIKSAENSIASLNVTIFNNSNRGSRKDSVNFYII